MVETTAKTKLCPFTMQPVGSQDAYQTHDVHNVPGIYPISLPVHCVGSSCMAWEQLAFVMDEPNEGYCKLVEERSL